VDTASRRGLIVAAACAAPFCAGALLFAPAANGIDGPSLWPCPFRTLTGLPCPMCGATRSVVLFANGDGRFLDYNPWWVAVLIAALVGGLAVAALGRLRRRPPPPAALAAAWRRASVPALVATLAVGWAVALLHADAIVR
jgi:hypothetical protein